MALNVWTQISGYNFGTVSERVTQDIALPIQLGSIQTTDETGRFRNVYSDFNDNEFFIYSTGLPDHVFGPFPNENNPNTVVDQNWLFTVPRLPQAQISNNTETPQGPIGVAINGVPFFNPKSTQTAIVGSSTFTLDANNLTRSSIDDGSGEPQSSSIYHYTSDPKLLYTDTAGQHSPLLGYSFDGYPIYGPYGYVDPNDATSGVQTMTSSYRIYQFINRPDGTTPDGTYVEDYEFVDGLGTLDKHNGRYCITPEYPQGTYAYFISVDPSDRETSVYPYIVGPTYKGIPTVQDRNKIIKGLNDTSFTEISGELPPGLRIEKFSIVGTPYEVARTVEFTFVIRAQDLENNIEDRYFTMSVEGADEPQWITAEGALPAGRNNAFFVLDNQPVDFQLSAIDPDIATNQRLEYFMGEEAGELPDGLTMDLDGRITGFVEPILALEPAAGTGSYDTNLYDGFPYDFGVRSDNGFDTYFYDNVVFDFNENTRSPKKLNRNYEFRVSVTDGETTTDRIFRIYVVGDDHLRADNTIMKAGDGVFSADNTPTRAPIWLTPSDLGAIRSNNYKTVYLDVYASTTLEGVIQYDLVAQNPDGSDSILPPGLTLDAQNGELRGTIPYQTVFSKDYQFTIKAYRTGTPSGEVAESNRTFTLRLLGEIDSVISWQTNNDLGNIPANLTSLLKVEAVSTIPGKLAYEVISGTLPPGLRMTRNGEIIGKVNLLPRGGSLGLTVFDNDLTTFDARQTRIDRLFTFTVRVQDPNKFSASTKTFTINVVDPDRSVYSNVYIKPMPSKTSRKAFSDFINNSNIFDYEKIYRPADPEFGLQKQLRMLLYSGIETKTANEYISAMVTNHKRRRLKFGDIKTAKAQLPGSLDTIYEVVYVEIIDDLSTEVTGLPNELELVRPTNEIINVNQDGINPVDGPLNTQFAQDKLNDPEVMRFRPDQDPLKADFDLLQVSDTNIKKLFPSGIKNMREAIASVGSTDYDFLPLWMRTVQEGDSAPLGYVKCVPLCYTKPGQSESIRLAIGLSNFDFSQISYDFDRYIIDSTTGNAEEQFLVFNNNQFNI
jgi:hypothetical protein